MKIGTREIQFFSARENKYKQKLVRLTLVRLGFLKVVFFFLEEEEGKEGCGQFESPLLLPPSFKFQEESIQYPYNFIQLLNNLFEVG